jgi:hypothetical protein
MKETKKEKKAASYWFFYTEHQKSLSLENVLIQVDTYTVCVFGVIPK